MRLHAHAAPSPPPAHALALQFEGRWNQGPVFSSAKVPAHIGNIWVENGKIYAASDEACLVILSVE